MASKIGSFCWEALANQECQCPCHHGVHGRWGKGRALVLGSLKVVEELVRVGRWLVLELDPTAAQPRTKRGIPLKGRACQRLPLSEVLKAQPEPALWLPNLEPRPLKRDATWGEMNQGERQDAWL